MLQINLLSKTQNIVAHAFVDRSVFPPPDDPLTSSPVPQSAQATFARTSSCSTCSANAPRTRKNPAINLLRPRQSHHHC